MRTTILIAVCAMLVLSSCQKKHCWVCTYEYNGEQKSLPPICDKTKKEINDALAPGGGMSGGAYKCDKQ